MEKYTTQSWKWNKLIEKKDRGNITNVTKEKWIKFMFLSDYSRIEIFSVWPIET